MIDETIDKESIMTTALSFLGSEAGKKLLGDNVNIEVYKKQIAEEKNELKKEKLKEKLTEFIPKFKKFTIEGRLYDKITSKPMEGVKVTPILAITEDDISTDNKGEFSITLELPILPFNQKALVQPKLIYTKDGYVPSTSEVVTQQRQVKTDVKTVPLLNIKLAAKEAANEAEEKIYEGIDKAVNIALSIPEKIISIRMKLIQKQTKIVFGILLPLGFSLLAIFGITKIKDKNKSVCPTKKQLSDAVKKRNKIAKTINQIYAIVALNVGLAVLFTYIAIQLRGAKNSIQSLSFPTSVPPGVGVPYSLISALEEVKKLIDKFRKATIAQNISLVISLIFLVIALKIIVSILDTIDSLIFKCAPKSLPLLELNQDLKDLFLKEEETIDTRQFINGFNIEVIEVDKNSIDGIKRKQAVGKNNRGIIMVRGKESFSSSDQVLIDELKFYIQVNNIKPF
jgi:hypothetical protein